MEKNKINLLLYTGLVIAFTFVAVLTFSMFSTLSPTDVYAPAGGRGTFAKDMITPVREGDGPCKYQSDYSICTCDSEAMQKAIDSYNRVHGA